MRCTVRTQECDAQSAQRVLQVANHLQLGAMREPLSEFGSERALKSKAVWSQRADAGSPKIKTERLRTPTTDPGVSTSSRTEAPQPPPRCFAGPLLWAFRRSLGRGQHTGFNRSTVSLASTKLPNPQKGTPRGDSWQPVKRSCSSVSSVRFSNAR